MFDETQYLLFVVAGFGWFAYVHSGLFFFAS